jgi:hypothetical protein
VRAVRAVVGGAGLTDDGYKCGPGEQQEVKGYESIELLNFLVPIRFALPGDGHSRGCNVQEQILHMYVGPFQFHVERRHHGPCMLNKSTKSTKSTVNNTISLYVPRVPRQQDGIEHKTNIERT